MFRIFFCVSLFLLASCTENFPQFVQLFKYSDSTVKDLELSLKENTTSQIDFSPAIASVESGYTVSIANPPANGSLNTINLTQMSFTPVRDFIGTVETKFTVTFKSGIQREATLRLKIGSDFQKLKPALAVRGSACILCHAQIDGSVVTDFGYGSPYFMGSDQPAIKILDAKHPYTDNTESISLANITGSFVVPNQDLPASAKSQFPINIASLTDYVKWRRQDTFPNTSVRKADLYIGAPTHRMIRDIAGWDNSEVLRHAYYPQGSYTSTPTMPDGLQRNDVKNFYSNQNTATLKCSGDLVIQGTLLLNHLTVDTTAFGCRIYVDGSVFVQGGISIPNPAGNVQISSSRAIIMGMGYDSIQQRWVYDDRGANFFTREEPDALVGYQKIKTELLKVQDLVFDATVTNGPGREQTFERLLLNAPHVHSRYSGNFKGVIIAEIAMFTLGNFKFQYDPIFDESNVQILPRLNKDNILSIK